MNQAQYGVKVTGLRVTDEIYQEMIDFAFSKIRKVRVLFFFFPQIFPPFFLDFPSFFFSIFLFFRFFLFQLVEALALT